MSRFIENSSQATLHFLIIFGILEALIWGFPVFELKSREVKTAFSNSAFVSSDSTLIILQNNTLLPLSSPPGSKIKVVQRIKVIVTAYSSSPLETDDNPYLTAAGTRVRDGVVANNLFPFGTKIRLPELYGEKIFVVEDRMHWKKGYYHIDIWFPSRKEALEFGAKRTYIEILQES